MLNVLLNLLFLSLNIVNENQYFRINVYANFLESTNNGDLFL